MADTELVTVATDSIAPCSIQPRVNFSVDLIAKLAASMRAGRHDPLLEVERVPGQPTRFQILCGEQRWRAAREAGLKAVLVRVHRRLGYLERLEKQYEENHLRADLDPVEDGACILAVKTLKDTLVAERLLRDALVAFQPLDDKRVENRQQFLEHLDGLRRLMRKHRIDTERLSPWSETEKALGISESQRKAKVGILRLDPELQETVRDLPAEHAIQISRLPDRERQAELATHAPEMTHRQIHDAVERLRKDPGLSVADAVNAPSTEDVRHAPGDQMIVVGDLCRQLVRLIAILRGNTDDTRRPGAVLVLTDLRKAIDEFLEVA